MSYGDARDGGPTIRYQDLVRGGGGGYVACNKFNIEIAEIRDREPPKLSAAVQHGARQGSLV